MARPRRLKAGKVSRRGCMGKLVSLARRLGSDLGLGRLAALGVPQDVDDEQGHVFPGNLANLFIVSGVSLAEADGPMAVRVERARGSKCERCWTFSENVGRLSAHPGVCERCAAVLEELAG